ncbi:hypothetical protein [Modestobacter versicolor]|uniref:Uncharacterized protein n=1 Tax=Modestobacter versicolor TaxID=429133 RepID=A0A839YB89_9ACTN|nr:hypothetical protein [Modestobacter versicolor]MBB3677614.1 hypothetical protein [Modestobacter versicolor]
MTSAAEQELRRSVGWTVTDPSPGRRTGRVLGGLLHAVSTVVTLGADAAQGARRPTWEAPADPDGYLDLGPVELRFPASARAREVRATRHDVWTTSAGAPPSRVPVRDWQVVAAVPADDAAHRDAAAGWQLTVTDGSTTGTLSGAWLALAWIGQLAGWPEPAPAP